MKRILSVIALASVVAISCNTNPQAPNTTQLNSVDTTGFAQFQQWKAQHELSTPDQYGQTSTSANTANRQTVVYVPEHRTVRHYRSGRTVYTSSSSNTAYRRGWSRAAKGAVIGGAGGAILGAVIDRKSRLAGGVIGGVLGAGAGYGIGRHLDKKHGRY